MKQSIERLVVNGRKNNNGAFRSTLLMILLFLTFWGVSFYVLVNSMA